MSTACYAVVDAKDAAIWYYGEQYGYEGMNLFLVQISDVEADGYNLRPAAAGKVFRFYLLTEKNEEDTGKPSPSLPSGTYTCGGETPAAGTFIRQAEDGYSSFYSEGTTDVLEEWSSVAFSDGELTVSLEDGIYTISTRATLAGNDGENRIVRGRFSGECPVEDLSDGVRYIYEDIDEEYEGVGAQIYDLMDWEMMAPYINSFNITAYNCPVDEAGYVAGAGYVLSLNLYSPLRPYGDMSAICGTYTVKSVIEDYAAYAGYIYGGVVYGTAVTYYGDDCTPKYLAPITIL